MISAFLRYFFSYILRAKTRQHLLYLAVFGLFISSFALLVLQSTMGGLQNNLMNRSKAIVGSYEIKLQDERDPNKAHQFHQLLKENGIVSSVEYEIELLVKYRDFITPVIVHGIDQKIGLPKDFLSGVKINELVVPLDLASRLSVTEGDAVQLISPSHVNSLMNDIPRVSTVYVEKLFSTDVPEIDQVHSWVRLPVIQNLIRKREVNLIRILSPVDREKLEVLVGQYYPQGVKLISWEEKNATLVWALKLENSVMLFLFGAMSFLVSLAITSSLLIFFDKIKLDLSSFWILGSSKKSLFNSSGKFLFLLSILSVGVGIVSAYFFLQGLDKFGPDIMPDVFVDRRIPVHITTSGVLISFFIPFSISLAFSFFTLEQFKKETDFLENVRTVGG